MQPSHNLTPAESRRRDAFEKTSASLAEQGFERTDLVVGVVKANVMAVVIMLPLVVLLAVCFCMANPGSPVLPDTEVDVTVPWLALVALFALLLILTVAHEAIHGLVWGLCAPERFKAIEFGVIWKMITPYCTCSAPLNRWQYVVGGAMPTIVLGIVPAVIAIAIDSPFLMALALLMILGGGGDALVILKILRFPTKGRTVVFHDHPYECGVVAFARPQEKAAAQSC